MTRVAGSSTLTEPAAGAGPERPDVYTMVETRKKRRRAHREARRTPAQAPESESLNPELA
ncbi:hypothetical protein [Amycolatopsis sp. cmx-4-61]|uniref:hypothetical protein n=1 Tax=Amycolatopsis sp. cmx-4-61 TaxID=2790937 RepID=UPI00397807E2